MEQREQNDHAEMRERLRAWRHAHPHATFDEIEEAVQQEIVRLQAQLVEDILAAERVEGDRPTSEAPPARPACPSCQAPMRPCGHRAREVLSRLGHPVQVARAYFVCPACGAGLFPPR